MRLSFQQIDVFTDQLFGGNPLAVFTEGDGLDTGLMQRIAREMNLSETTFIQTPAEKSCAFKVRIFTPGCELPFAGHPTIGTAYVLDRLGRLPKDSFHFEERVGPVALRKDSEGRFWMTPPRAATSAPLENQPAIARAFGLDEDSLCAPVRTAGGGGTTFLCVMLESNAAVDAARPDRAALASATTAEIGDGFLLMFSYADGRAYSRMIASPESGVGEDPATGGSIAPLCQFLYTSGKLAPGTNALVIEQGTKIGRQSFLHVRLRLGPSEIEALEAGGDCVPVFESSLEI